MTAPSATEHATYTLVCRVEDIEIEGGVCALVGGRAIAIFRTHDGNIHAISNYDPCSKASVLSRGIVGTRGDVPFVASPMHKQAYDLVTGVCLDVARVAVPVYPARVHHGLVEVAVS